MSGLPATIPCSLRVDVSEMLASAAGAGTCGGSGGACGIAGGRGAGSGDACGVGVGRLRLASSVKLVFASAMRFLTLVSSSTGIAIGVGIIGGTGNMGIALISRSMFAKLPRRCR